MGNREQNCCDELEKDYFIKWDEGWSPPGWVIYEGAQGEYRYAFITYCPYCGKELEEHSV